MDFSQPAMLRPFQFGMFSEPKPMEPQLQIGRFLSTNPGCNSLRRRRHRSFTSLGRGRDVMNSDASFFPTTIGLPRDELAVETRRTSTRSNEVHECLPVERSLAEGQKVFSDEGLDPEDLRWQ